ncbi:hypothetical protein TWF506_008224 [Arthrobotrys conoides]|uniref:CCHC-type domain-containing protein n=1 Tax=Arthrobotrys conoides TaxID=74498 RepID=A0AAN8NMY7_9PEZI
MSRGTIETFPFCVAGPIMDRKSLPSHPARCGICLRNNHMAESCYYKDVTDPSKIRKLPVCPACGKIGHGARDCWQPKDNCSWRSGGIVPQQPRKSGAFVLPQRPGAPRVAMVMSLVVQEENVLLLNLEEEPRTLSSSMSKSGPTLPLSLAEKTLLDLSDEEFEASKSSSVDRKPSPRAGTGPGGCGPLHEPATLLVDVRGSFEAGPQPLRAPSLSGEELFGLVLSGGISPDREARKRVSFALVTSGKENPVSKPVCLGDGKPLERETTLYNKTVAPDSDVKALSGGEKENSSKQKTNGDVGGRVGAEAHIDFTDAWTASIDYQHHISSDWTDFEQLVELRSPVSVRMRNGETLVATHGGACCASFRVGSNQRGFNLTDALYLPDFEGKVMALWRLAASGYQLEVNEDSINILKDCVLGAQALRIGDRFVFTSEEEMEEQREWEEWLREEGVSGFKKIVRKTKEERERGREKRERKRERMRKMREQQEAEEAEEAAKEAAKEAKVEWRWRGIVEEDWW